MTCIVSLDGVEHLGAALGDVDITAHDHVADHALQAHTLAVFRAVDACDAVGLQLGNFAGDDDTATTAKNLNVTRALFTQQVDHVFEVLDVAALVGADRNALHVFLQGGGDHVVNAAVVPQMDHFGTHALQDAAHDIDGRIVAVKQAGRRYKADLIFGTVVCKNLRICGQVSNGGLTVDEL